MPSYVVVSLGSSLCFAAGMGLQKRAVAERGLRSALRSASWQLGLLIILVAAVLQAQALAMGDVEKQIPHNIVGNRKRYGDGSFDSDCLQKVPQVCGLTG